MMGSPHSSHFSARNYEQKKKKIIFLISLLNLNSDYLVISFANWLIFINEKLSHEYVIADETTHAFGMIEFLAGFDAIAFDRLLTFATSFRDFGITFVTIRFITPLKKFPIDFLSAGTALKALFVVDFAEGCAAFHAHWFFANTTFS